MLKMRSSNIFVIFVVVLNGCFACFRTNDSQKISIKTGSSFYKECQCTEPGFTVTDLHWLNNNDQPIELGPGTNSNVFTETEDESLNLHISSVTKTLSGTYKCITKANGKMYIQSYTVAAYEPLYFYDTPTVQNLVLGQTSPIICQPKSDSTSVIIRWQKGKDEPAELPNDKRYEVRDNGLYINNVTNDDAGSYICTAQVIATNEEVDKFIDVEVITVPEILELKANPGTRVVVGKRLVIDCIANGTPNPDYVWNMTLGNINEKEQAKLKQESGDAGWKQEINSIIFDPVLPIHRGNYTCYAFNEAGYSTMEVFVDVLIPPTITNFANITNPEATTIQLICNATGNPEPDIFISYEGKDWNSDIDPSNYEVMSNEAFVYLDRNQQGIYVCNATNEVNSAAAAMFLSVLHQPYFDSPNEHIWGWEGATVNISCLHDSNPKASVVWRFQSKNLQTEQENEINRELLPTLNNMLEPFITMTIDNKTIYGDYKCTATNKYGVATKYITLQEGFRPDNVTTATFTEITATTVTFQIENPGTHIGPAIIGYRATYDEATNFDITDIHINRTWSIDRPFKLEKLKPNTTYYVKFAALNEVGASDWSEELEFTTEEKSVPEPPVWADDPITLASNSHVLKWKAPDDNGEPIDHYTLTYCSERDEPCKTKDIISPATELELADLEFNTTYLLELVAHNTEGNSTAANISVIVPAPDMVLPSTLLSSGAIIGVSIVIIVLCLILLDVLLLVWRRQGIIATCCYKKETKRKGSIENTRDKKGLLTPVEERPPRPSNGHREYEYNKNTGVVTGKHSEV